MRATTKPPVRLLVADDSDVNRLILRQFLHEGGYTVDEAADGEEAVRLFRENRYGVVLLDLRMPRLDGLAAARRMREWEAREHRPPTPILAVSIGADEAAALAAGCQAVLERPVRREALLAVVAALTGDGGAGDLAAATAMLRAPSPEPQVAHLLPRLLQRLNEERQAMARHAAAGEWPAVAELAHRGLGQCAVFGVPALEGVLAALERAANGGRVEAAVALLTRYESLLKWHMSRPNVASVDGK